MYFPAMSVRPGKAPITNSVLTFFLPQLHFVLPGEISLHFLEDQPLYEVWVEAELPVIFN